MPDINFYNKTKKIIILDYKEILIFSSKFLLGFIFERFDKKA